MAETPDKRRVAYYYDPDVGSYTYGLGHPMKPHRIHVTHHLVSAYNMLDKMHVLRAKRASAETMTRFHTDEYVHFLSRVTPETADELTYHGTRFLVGEDNPAFEGVFEFCSMSAGGSIAAANRLASGSADIAINWAGGLHHAKKREASGFCYINDIVLGILELLRTYPRVLYVDIDCHHGDGVEEAFYTTDRVMTCSFHKYGEYFPGTGTQEDRGRGRGKGYAVNVPLKDGITDESYKSVFEPVISRILEVYRPSAVWLQCGSDSLAGDKLGCFNLTMHGHAACVQFFRKQNIPLVLVGGGGYTVKNVARTWCYETACALGIEVDERLPWNEYFEWFGPRYRLEVLGNNMEDLNMREGSLDKVRINALKHLSELRPAPSVGMHDVPRESLGHHLGFSRDDDDSRAKDELDERLAQHTRFVYKLQEHQSHSNADDHDQEEDDWESDASSSTSSRKPNKRSTVTRSRSRAHKKRMSIITNQQVDYGARTYEFEQAYSEYNHHPHHHLHQEREDVVVGKKTRRKFFSSKARWDDEWRGVLVDGDVEGFVEGFGLSGVGMGMKGGEVGRVMERGGRGEDGMDEDEEGDGEEW